MDQLFSLKGKLAIVTGSSKGIGQGIAEGLASAGANIIGVNATPSGESSQTQKLVEAHGRKYSSYQVNLGKREEVYAFVKQIQAEFPTIDILVNNAGVIRRAPLIDHTDQLWDEVIEVNLTAGFILAREIGRGMVERRSGKIIFVGSLLSFQGGIQVPGYAASKGGVARLVQGFANEWAGMGVNVNGIAPGYIETDNTKPIREQPERMASISARIPQQRWGTPEDLKGPVIFLASNASRYVNGEMLVVDGGWMGR